ncbi:MAG: hypothetical protein IPO27_17760 [Bacteroidetes bacterium]|nr:hypothetical protein [Bacteroidota bacterium]
MKLITKTFWLLTIFSIAMGFIETAVVVYLRELFYPNGFAFPLTSMSNTIIITELLRELATIIMLASIGYMAGKNAHQRFANFIFCFAVWDIFYYVFLKVLLNWPDTILDWDILFLIPVPWVGPVLAPVLISMAMIVWYFLIHYHDKKIEASTWSLFAAGSLIAIGSFIYEHVMAAFAGINLLQYSHMYIPQHFNWYLFACGFGLILMSLWHYTLKAIQENELYLITINKK